MGEEENMKKRKPKTKGKVTARRREVMDLVKFIDAHGGKLGAYRGYGVASDRPRDSAPARQ